MNLIKKVTLIENFMCVYRNYSFLSEGMKFLASLRISLTLMFYLYAFAQQLQGSLILLDYWDRVNHLIVVLYVFFSKLNTIAAIVLGIIKAQSFENYVLSIDSVHKLCSHDAEYPDALKKLNKRVSIIACLYASLGIIVIGVYFYHYRYQINLSNMFLFYTIIDFLVNLRYISESFAFYAFIEIVVSSLRHLYCSVSAVVLILKDDSELVCGPEDFLELGKQLKRWEAASRHLTNCSDQLKTGFGLQIGLSLFTATTYYIALLYEAACLLAQKNDQKIGNHISVLSLLVLMSCYVIIKILIVTAGQRAHSEVKRLSTALAKLHALLVGISGSEAAECARTVVALTRRLRVAPLSVRLCAGVAVQMSLLTDILTIVASYTIILLQFNNVM